MYLTNKHIKKIKYMNLITIIEYVVTKIPIKQWSMTLFTKYNLI